VIVVATEEIDGGIPDGILDVTAGDLQAFNSIFLSKRNLRCSHRLK